MLVSSSNIGVGTLEDGKSFSAVIPGMSIVRLLSGQGWVDWL
jgi:hypothetical protein